ncbi:hypothetical protein EIKCOROL_02119 [Eikenella corrodens ATCC 23834]|uniref:Uncharacterized protein n=1 Tax=Eikenella corrodens ATCC 23834 TaxID=546274 RepID=C0DXK8_EIKCO|nr:hypothetical protein EIKCOROL_02119 [Eikenella corrodens ATCC 23834]
MRAAALPSSWRRVSFMFQVALRGRLVAGRSLMVYMFSGSLYE